MNKKLFLIIKLSLIFSLGTSISDCCLLEWESTDKSIETLSAASWIDFDIDSEDNEAEDPWGASCDASLQLIKKLSEAKNNKTIAALAPL